MKKNNFTLYGVKVFLVCYLIISFSFNFVSAAGTPSIFSYQGRLTNSSGNLLGGSGTIYNFKFSIWNNPTVGSGSKLWPTNDPSVTPLTVRTGVFNVNIGDTDNGYLDALDYNFALNKDIYLQVEVYNGTSYEALSPRQRISSTIFAQIAGSVSGLGQSSFGTTNPNGNAVITVEATTSSAVPVLIRGAAGQSASLLKIEDSSSNQLFSIDPLGGILSSSTLVIGSSESTSLIVNSTGKVGIGTITPDRRLNVLEADSVPQMRLSQGASVYSEIYVDPTGDVTLSSTGGNVRLQNENLWVCSGGSCGIDTPDGKGNIVVENAVIFNNKFKLKQVDASTTVMYDSIGEEILMFDEGQ